MLLQYQQIQRYTWQSRYIFFKKDNPHNWKSLSASQKFVWLLWRELMKRGIYKM